MCRTLMLLSLATGLFATGAAGAGPEPGVIYTFNISERAGIRVVRMDSTNMGFRFRDLRRGESRNAVADTGENVLVTRGPSGFEVNVDGADFSMPQTDAAVEADSADVGADHRAPDGPAQQSILDRIDAISGAQTMIGANDVRVAPTPILEIIADVGSDGDGYVIERLIVKKKRWKKK